MKTNRRSFMQMLAGVTAGILGLSKETKSKVSYDPRPQRATIQEKEYDLIADLVEEMKKFDKNYLHRFDFSIHCSYTGLAILNDTGCLEREDYYGCVPQFEETHILWIPFTKWRLRIPLKADVYLFVSLQPFGTHSGADIGIIGTHNGKSNKFTHRYFNVNREEEGKIIAGNFSEIKPTDERFNVRPTSSKFRKWLREKEKKNE